MQASHVVGGVVVTLLWLAVLAGYAAKVSVVLLRLRLRRLTIAVGRPEQARPRWVEWDDQFHLPRLLAALAWIVLWVVLARLSPVSWALFGWGGWFSFIALCLFGSAMRPPKLDRPDTPGAPHV